MAIREILDNPDFKNPIIEANLSIELYSDGDQGLVGIVKQTPLISKLRVDFSHYKKGFKEKMENDSLKQQFRRFYPSLLTWFDKCMYTAKAFARIRDGSDAKYFPPELVPMQMTEEDLDHQLSNVFIQHLKNDHVQCWKTVCFINSDEGMMPYENLFDASYAFVEQFRKFLVSIIRVQDGRSRIVDDTTSPNENLYSGAHQYVPKHKDFGISYPCRVDVFCLDRNDGLPFALKALREMIGHPMEAGSGEEITLNRLWNERLKDRKYHVDQAEKKAEQKMSRVAAARGNADSANPDEQFAAYKEQETVLREQWRPIHASPHHDKEFLCECKAFPRADNAFGLCKICEFRRILPALEPTNRLIHCLRSCFGHNSFRDIQQSVLEHILVKQRSCIAIMPTGKGKTLLAMIPAIFNKDILFLVIGPLRALLQSLYKEFIKCQITAAVYDGKIQVLLLTPEMLGTNSISRAIHLVKREQNREIVVVVDEIHKALEEGSRQYAYTNVGMIPSKYTIMMTATAGFEDLDSIVESTGVYIAVENVFVSPNSIPDNVEYTVTVNPTGMDKTLAERVKEVLERDRKVIVFCAKIKTVETLALTLTRLLSSSMLASKQYGIQRYHSKLDSHQSKVEFDAFVNGNASVMIATSGFGTGTNSKGVDLVIHYNFPINLRELVQQSGRGGRDGNGHMAKHVLMFQPETGQHALEDVLCTEGNEIRNWDVLRKDIAGVKLYASLKQCRRFLLLKYCYQLEPRQCNSTEIHCDICKLEEINEVTVGSALKSVLGIIEVITKEGQDLSTDELFSIWKPVRETRREEKQRSHREETAYQELVTKQGKVKEAGVPIYLEGCAKSEPKRRVLLEWLIYNGYVKEDVTFVRNATNAGGFTTRRAIRNLIRTEFDVDGSGLAGVSLRLRSLTFLMADFDIYGDSADYSLTNLQNMRALVLENLTWWTTDEDLYLACLSSGIPKESLSISDISFAEFRGNGKSKGTAQIVFQSNKDALTAKAYFDINELHNVKPIVRVSLYDSFRPHAFATSGPAPFDSSQGNQNMMQQQQQSGMNAGGMMNPMGMPMMPNMMGGGMAGGMAGGMGGMGNQMMGGIQPGNSFMGPAAGGGMMMNRGGIHSGGGGGFVANRGGGMMNSGMMGRGMPIPPPSAPITPIPAMNGTPTPTVEDSLAPPGLQDVQSSITPPSVVPPSEPRERRPSVSSTTGSTAAAPKSPRP
ncbi:hypothetical protein HDU79_011037, partial [Rhizoclosmatium sp. JEL0117]